MNERIKNIVKRVSAGIMLCAVTVLGLTGCFDNNNQPMVSVSKEIVRVNADAQTIPVTVMSNTEWSAKSNADWITISKESGRGTTNIDLIVTSYKLTSEREGSVTVTISNGAIATIKVIQSAANGILMVSPSEMTVGANPSTISFAVASNSDWTVFSSKDWAVPTVSKGSGNAIVNVNVAANPSQSEIREAVISVIVKEENGESIVETTTIKQLTTDVASLTLAQNAVYFAHDAMSAGTGSVIIPVITNITGTISASCDFNWCNAVYYNGAVTILVENNLSNASRQALVTVMGNVDGEAVSSQIAVYQAGLGSPKVVFSSDMFVLEARDNTASNKQSVVTAYTATPAGVDLSVIEDYPSWIAAVSLYNNVLSFDVANNTLPEERQATITVVAKMGEETALFPVSVVQLGEDNLTASFSQEYINFTSKESEISIGAFANVSDAKLFATVSNADWCSVEVTDMSSVFSHSSAITIKAEANPNAEARTANVIVAIGSVDQRIVKSIPVYQAGIGGPDIQVLEENIIVPNAGSAVADNIAVNFIGLDAYTSLNIVSSESWIKGVLSSDKTRLLMVADANPYSADRVATITIIAKKGDQTQIIPISATQLGTGMAILEFERTSYSYVSEAASYMAFVKCLNGTKYAVVSQPEWLTVEAAMESNPTVLNFVLSKNEDADPRSGKVVLLATNGNDFRYYTIVVSQDGLNSPSVYPVAKNIVVPHIMSVTDHLDYSVRIIGAEDDDTSVEVTTADSWISKVYVSTDKKFIGFFCDTNEKVESRQGTITIIATRGGDIMTTDFTVTQLGTGSAGLEFAAQSYTVSSSAQKFNIPVGRINNSTYEIASLPSWITVNKDRTTPNNLWINISANTAADERSGEIIFFINNAETGRGDDNLYQSISITQAGVGGPNVIPVTTEIVFAQPGKQFINVKCVNSVDIFAAGDVKFSCSDTWINTPVVVAPSSIIFSVRSENNDVLSRTGTVSAIFTKGGKEQLINFTITQLGTGSAGLQFVTTNYEVSSPRQQLIIPLVKLNKSSYNVVEYPSFIERVLEQDDALYVTFSENKNAEDRSGEIVFKVTNSSSLIADETIYQTITVTQAGIGGPNVIPLTTSLTFGMKKDSNIVRSLNMDDNVKVKSFTSSEDWVKGSFDKNNHKSFVFTTTSDNTFVEARTAVVTVIVEKGGQTQILNFTITQLGTGSAGLTFYTNVYDIASDAQYLTVPLIALNSSVYKVVQTPSWMDVKEQTSEHVIFKVKENTNAEDRGGDVVFRVANSKLPDEIIYQSIQVNQAGIGGPNVIPVTTVLSFGKEADLSKYIKLVNSDGVDFNHFTYSQDWVEADVVKDNTTGLPKLKVTTTKANDNVAARTAVISVIVDKGGKEQILNFTVTQAGTGSAMLVFAQELYEIPAAKTSFDIQVIPMNSSVYKIIQYPEWFDSISNDHVSDAETKISVTVSKNSNSESRIGEIVIQVKNSNNPDEVIYQTIQVIQAGIGGPNVIATKSAVYLEKNKGSRQTISLINMDNVSITDITSTESWVRTSKSFELRKYNSTVQSFDIVAETRNDNVESRTAVITVVAEKGGFSQILNFDVTQAGTGSGTLSFVTDTYNAPAKASELSIPVIKQNDAYYTIQSHDAWLTPTIGNDSIKVAVAANPFAETRTGEIILNVQNSGRTDTLYQSITIIQAGIGGPEVAIVPSSITFSNAGKEKPYIVVSNYSGVTFTVISSDEWLSAPAYSEGKLAFTAPGANMSTEERNATVTVVAEKGGQTQVIKIPVTQLGSGSAGLEFASNSYNVPSSSGYIRIPIIKNNGSQYTVVSAPEWIVVKEETYSKNQLGLGYKKNTNADDRTAEVVFKVTNNGESRFQTISVTQAGVGGPNVIPATTFISFGKDGGSKENYFTYTDNVGISTVTASEDWVSVIVNNGITGALTFETTANTSAQARSAVATVIFTKGGKQQMINFTIEQAGTGSPFIEFVTDTYAVSATTTSVVAPFISYNGATATVVETPSWIDKDNIDIRTDYAATRRAVISFSANTAADDRSGDIVFEVKGGNETIYERLTITQAGVGGPNMVPTTDALVFDHNGGTKSIKFANIVDVTASSVTSDDASVAQASYSFSGGLRVTASSNTSASAKTALITAVFTKGGKTQILNFNVTVLGTGSPEVVFESDSYEIAADVTSVLVPYSKVNADSFELVYKDPLFTDVVINADGRIQFTLPTNSVNEAQSGKAVFKATSGDETVYYTVTVTRAGLADPQVVLSSTSTTFTAASLGQTRLIQFTNNAGATVSVASSVAWMSASVTDNTTPIQVTILANNNNAKSRSGKITVIATKGEKSQILSYTVTQLGTGSPDIVFTSDSYSVASIATGVAIPFYTKNGAVVTVVEYPEWMSKVLKSDYESAADNGQITATFTANNKADDRSGDIVVKVTGGQETIYKRVSVTQAGIGGPNVIPATDNVTFGAASDQIIIPYINGESVTFKCYSTEEWLSVTAADNMMTFTADVNSNAASRTATATVVATKGLKSQILTFSVNQLGTGSPKIVFANDRYEVSSNKIYVAVPYSGNTTIETVHKDDLISNVNITNAGFALLTLAANNSTEDQSGRVVFKATLGGETVYYTINVTRAGASGPNVVLGSTSTVYESNQTGTRGITLGNYPGVDIKAYSSKSWVTVGTVSNGVVSFAVNAINPNSATRYADITVVATKNGKSQMLNFTVTQLGAGSPSVQLSTEKIVSDADGGTQRVVLYTTSVLNPSNATFNYYSGEAGWFNIDPSSIQQSGNTYIVPIVVNSNASTSPRWGEIAFYVTKGSESVLYSIPVAQYGTDGPSVSVPVDQLSVSPYASNDNIIAFTNNNGKLETSKDADWITVTYPSTYHSAQSEVVRFNTTTNTTGTTRVGHITLKVIKANETLAKVVTIVQAAAEDPELVVVAPKDEDGQYHFNVDAKGDTLTAPLFGNNLDITSNEYPFEVVAKYGIDGLKATVTKDNNLAIVVPANTTNTQREGVVYIGVKKTGETSTYGAYYQMIPVYVSQLSAEDTYTLTVGATIIPVEKSADVTTIDMILNSSTANVKATVYAPRGFYYPPQTGKYNAGDTQKSWILFENGMNKYYDIPEGYLVEGENHIHLNIKGDNIERTGYIVFDNGKGKTVTVTVNQK